MIKWLEQVLGAAVMLVVLLDIAITVLYARAAAGIIANRVAAATWGLYQLASGPLGRHRALALSFCGPTILVLVVAAWHLGLTCGAAMIIHPRLGTSITTASGRTPTDFVSAIYAAGGSLSIVGAGDLTPKTSGARLLYLFNSLVGMSVVTLTLTYFMQVYTALQRRNALALDFHLLSGATGDAAELLAGLGPQDQFSAGHSVLASLASGLTAVKESHHFYSVLFYFRFRAPHYSVSRTALVALDTATLIRSALDDEYHTWLKQTAAVEQLERAALLLVTTLEETFLPGGAPDANEPPDGPTLDRWRRRYSTALIRLRRAGIRTIADERAGAESYVLRRARWDRYITALAPSMAYDIREIDPAGDNPESESAGRPPRPTEGRPTEGRRDDDEARADSESRWKLCR
jgi:hypothetical protein